MQTRTVLSIAWLLAAAGAIASRPNIVFILTDDQDTHMNSLEHMPLLQKHLVDEGTTYESHYCTVAICCPSRVNLWTGQMAHNTNVTDVSPPYGGYPKFVANGYNENHLALWMQQSGYNTYYTGKLFNSHTIFNYDSPPVSGYTGSEFLLDPFTYQYYNVTTTRNGQPPVNVVGQYSPDLIAERAYGFLEEGLEEAAETPFFLTIAPIAPHAVTTVYPKLEFGPPQFAERHRHLFEDYKIPRTDNFNPDHASGVSWVSQLEQLNDTVLAYNDEWQRCRLRSLQSVDEMIDNIVQRLHEAGVLDNTYIIYSSDNGYHISQHRMPPGKECGFETDINVPLIVRGPGVPAGAIQRVPTSHTDLAPTIMKLARNSVDNHKLDGLAIALDEESQTRSEHVGIEFWGQVLPEGKYGFDGNSKPANGRGSVYSNNTYKGLRIVGEDYSLYYSVWCTNEIELYDMKRDPGQLNNLLSADNNRAGQAPTLLGRDLKYVVRRLDALMMVIKSCREQTCVDPWGSLHPSGDVKSLSQAVRSHFDSFYEKQPKVSFDRCELGYIKEAEGQQEFLVFGEDPSDKFAYDGGMQRPVLIDPGWRGWA